MRITFKSFKEGVYLKSEKREVMFDIRRDNERRFDLIGDFPKPSENQRINANIFPKNVTIIKYIRT